MVQYLILSSLAIGGIYEGFKGKTSVPSYIFWTYLVSRVLIGVFIFLIFFKLFWSEKAIKNLFLLGISGFMFVIAFSFETLSFFYLNSMKDSDIAISRSLFNTSQYLIILPPLILMYFAVRSPCRSTGPDSPPPGRHWPLAGCIVAR